MAVKVNIIGQGNDPLPYETEIIQRLERVHDLAAFLQDHHISYDVVRSFLLHNDRRAAVSINTVGRILGRPLAQELTSARDLLERSLPFDLQRFSATANELFAIVDAIRPVAVTGDIRVQVEQHHYALDVRESLLTHILRLFNQRYRSPRFDSIQSAREWHEAFEQTIVLAEGVIRSSRRMLQQEAAAANDYIALVTEEIQEIERLATERFLLLRRIRWLVDLEEASTRINDTLALRSIRLDDVLLNPSADDADTFSRTSVGRTLSGTAPWLGKAVAVSALSLAGVVLARNKASELDLSAMREAVLPERSSAEDRNAASVAMQSAQHSASQLGAVVEQFTAQVEQRDAASAQAQAARTQVDDFFNRLPTSSGRQTLVIEDQSELRNLLDKLIAFGYREGDLLELLGLPSVSAFSQPISLDLRHGQQMPILFTHATDMQVTARLGAIPQVQATYIVQGGESTQALAQRFGTTVEALAQANPTLDATQPLQAGQRLVMSGPVAETIRERGLTLAPGSTLQQVADLFKSDPQSLATLNGIADAGQWRLQAGTLSIPAAAVEAELRAANATGTMAAIQTGALPAVQADQQTAAQAALAPSNEAVSLYRVGTNESIEQIAEQYGTTVEVIVADNHLPSAAVSAGQEIRIRRPATSSASAAVAQEAVMDSLLVRSSGGFGSSSPTLVAEAREPYASSPPRASAAASSGVANPVVGRYGSQLFPSIESMPDDARSYLLETTGGIAEFFNVRPGDILGILRQEQNNAGWRLQEPNVSTVGATGVGQVVSRTWNGWGNPERVNFVRNVANIEEHGGLGFDWAYRDAWYDWKYAGGDRSLLDGSNADPNLFENSASAVARHLVHWGLTTDFAERDPQGFAERLADAIAVYNSGRTLDESAQWTQSSANQKTVAQYVADAMSISDSLASYFDQPSVRVASPEAMGHFRTSFRDLFDRNLGQLLPDSQLDQLIAAHGDILESVQSGATDSDAAAIQLLEAVERQFMGEGYNAILTGTNRPWPYIHNPQTLYAQQTAVGLMGRTLNLPEMDDLMNRTQGQSDQIRLVLMERSDARLYTQARYSYDQLLQRSASGKPIYTHEVTSLLQPMMAGLAPTSSDEAAMHDVIARFEAAVKELGEYKQISGNSTFTAMPLSPMPALIRAFGVPINYQAGGKHTGIDVANPLNAQGQEPEIYAVSDATVTYVGPLYCDNPNMCRGSNAIILDHGGSVYSIYSHNSVAAVHAGDRVSAGQVLGRQGNEGYSFGSHLHFEVHVEAPFSGNWQDPWAGQGRFVDPMAYLPQQ